MNSGARVMGLIKWVEELFRYSSSTPIIRDAEYADTAKVHIERLGRLISGE